MESKDFDIVKLGTHRYWLLPDGNIRPVISGGADGAEDRDDDDDDDDTDDEGDNDEGQSNRKGGKTFTQRQVNAVATREKREGKKAGRRELLEELGFESVDELRESIQKQKEGKAKDDDELSKERKKLEKEKSDAEKLRSEAAKDRHDARVERRLLSAGVPLKKLEKVARLVDVEIGVEADEIDDAIDSIKEDFPELFGSNSDSEDTDEDDSTDRGKRKGGTEPRKKVQDSNPGRKAGGSKAKSLDDRVKDRLAARHPEFKKQSS